MGARMNLRPLDPVFDEDKRTGAMATGNTPGVIPTGPPPVFEVAGAQAFANYPATQVDTPLPSGYSGDYGIICAFGNATNVVPTVAGWTLISSRTYLGSLVVAMFGRRLDGTEGATIPVVTAGGNSNIAASMIFSGVRAAIPFTVPTAGEDFTIASVYNPADFTVGLGGTGILVLGSNGGNTVVISGGSGMVERLDTTITSGTRRSMYAGAYEFPAGGVIDPGTWTLSTVSGVATAINCELHG